MTRRQAAAFAVVSLVWGCTWTVIRDQIHHPVPPSWSVSYRFLLAAGIMAAYAQARGKSLALPREGWALAAALGLFQFLINFNLVYEAERHVTSGLIAVVFALLVVPNAVLAWAFIGQRLQPRVLVGAALGIGGVALLYRQEFIGAGSLGGNAAFGAALTGLAVLSASTGNVMNAGGLAQRLSPYALLTGAMAIGALMNAAYAWITTGPPAFAADWTYVAGVLYLAGPASALAFLLYYDLIRQIGPARAAYTNLAVPFIAMTLSTLFEGYRWTPYAIAGAVLAAAGMVLALRPRRTA